MYHRFDLDGEAIGVWLSRAPTGYRLQLENGWSGAVDLLVDKPGQGRLIVAGESEPVVFALDGDTAYVHYRGSAHAVRFLDPLVALAVAGDEVGQNVSRAPMPGTVVSIKVAVGDKVATGAVLMVIESMKLETAIRAPQDGVVTNVHVRESEVFDRDALLITLSQEIA